jgi:hypothetical protein
VIDLHGRRGQAAVTLRIELHRADTGVSSGEVRLRALLMNDGYEPVAISRNAFVGPNVSDAAGAMTRPESVEATFGAADEPLTLQPFTFYGRERRFDNLGDGETTATAHYRPDGDSEISASVPIFAA